MNVKFAKIGEIKDRELKFAVIVSRFEGKWVFVQHEKRDTWEIPGGHREPGESIEETADRELFEETGAVEFFMNPVCEYCVERDDKQTWGRVFLADVKKFGELPQMEIAKVEYFENIPENQTYPEIQPLLHEQVVKFIEK